MHITTLLHYYAKVITTTIHRTVTYYLGPVKLSRTAPNEWKQIPEYSVPVHVIHQKNQNNIDANPASKVFHHILGTNCEATDCFVIHIHNIFVFRNICSL